MIKMSIVVAHQAFEESPRFAGGAIGKEGLKEYESRGFLPTENGGEVVSRTLDYGYADFSTAVALKFLAQTGTAAMHDNHHAAQDAPYYANIDTRNRKYLAVLNKEDLVRKADSLFARSQRGFSALFDRERGLMVPKDRAGRASFRFDPLEWGNGFTEGNSWHHSFPPYAVSCAVDEEFLQKTLSFDCKGGLLALHGGREQLREKLLQLLQTKSHFRVGSYGQVIIFIIIYPQDAL